MFALSNWFYEGLIILNAVIILINLYAVYQEIYLLKKHVLNISAEHIELIESIDSMMYRIDELESELSRLN